MLLKENHGYASPLPAIQEEAPTNPGPQVLRASLLGPGESIPPGYWYSGDKVSLLPLGVWCLDASPVVTVHP